MKTLYVAIALFLCLGALKAANPVVTGVTILGEALYNTGPNPDHVAEMTGFYSFSDADHEADASTYKWYAGNSADGTGKVVIAGATSKRFVITSAQYGKYLFFEVTPKDAGTPAETNSPVLSAGKLVTSTTYTNANISDVIRSSGTTHYFNVSMDNTTSFTATGSGTVVYVHGDFNLDNTNTITINIVNGAKLYISGAIVTKNNITVNVDGTSELVVESGLIAKNGSALTINGSMNINGDLTVEGNASFNVGTGGSLDVAGDVTLAQNGTVVLSGSMNVGGSFDTGSGGTITVNGTGSLDVSGDLLGNAVIGGTGPVTVGGLVDPNINDSGTAQINGSLPIELIEFVGFESNQEVVLKWSTLAEINNNYFTIERSTDGVNYVIIANLSGAGNSSNIIKYQFIDHYPNEGVNYYRLKQTDYDGIFSYHGVISVRVISGSFSNSEPLLYPNPLSHQTNAIFVQPLFKNFCFQISIFDISGKQVYKNLLINENGQIYLSAPLNKGIYTVRFENSENMFTQKLLVD